MAESVMELPTTVEPLDKVVEIDGEVLWTVRVSEPHVLLDGLLLTSPLYVARQLNTPVPLNVTETGPADAPMRATVRLATGRLAHALSE